MDVKRPPVFLLWGLLSILISLGSSVTLYIQSGSDITACNMKCPHPEGVLELYRECRGVSDPLLEHYCDDSYTKNYYKNRLDLDTQSGCWRMSQAESKDSCVYNTEFHSSPTRQLSSIDIRVLDPVLISNIVSNGSRLGEDMTVSVQFSGEESAVSWEVDGEPLHERYRLIDDNRTLIIPSVQRDDAERTFRVRITNPVSNDTKNYKLIDDPIFSKMQEAEGLLCMAIISGSSGTVYVRSGSDISGSDMKCPEDDVTLELYRQCGGEERTLLENHCYYNHMKSHDPRLRLDTGNGCWKLRSAGKDDSCVYKIWLYTIPERLISSTEIRVLDPVLISNITSNGSRLGEDMAVSVQFSGEESAVTWEVDGEPLHERYRLIDDNRTLIIPSVQRDDAERTFRVRITNPVSEETKDYKLIDDPIFSKVQKAEDSNPDRSRWALICVPVILAVILAAAVVLYVVYKSRTKEQERTETERTETERTETERTETERTETERICGCGYPE